ncbi:MAG TPA: hypothetical protein VG276_24860 [Actinomycetes bacterium]|jgi:hypothetical protein|nr:hypothetical protein [Actinomycetes bacterium]
MRATISKATPLGALGTDALVYDGQLLLKGSSKALRGLAGVLTQAAALADEYDRDPEAWNARERAERDADR